MNKYTIDRGFSVGPLSRYFDSVTVLDETDSTNSYIKRNIGVLPARSLVCAYSQTGGRGRMGRTFYSPAGGAYFSVLLKNAENPASAKNLTVYAAVSAAEAIGETTGLDIGIKWVNDLYFGGKKIAGILCEAVTEGEDTHLICGVGINVVRPKDGYPPEIEDRAAAISDFTTPPDVGELIASVAPRICGFPSRLSDGEIVDRYRKRSFVCGKKIRVAGKEVIRTATALAICDDASLLVEYEDGSREKLDRGDISIII